MATSPAAESARERISMDPRWRFALGHASDPGRDYGHGGAYFSYLAKAGYAGGNGPSDKNFDDRAWRVVDLPHDWAVELPFDAGAGHSHGYHALGPAYPQNSVGWYRKLFRIPRRDRGKRITVEFEGSFRDSRVWINGFYVGVEPSGYTGFAHDITDYLDYGGVNTLAVRVDATKEEGWFYEGAGIYRHTWLVKTHPLHVVRHGLFVTTRPRKESADVKAEVAVLNQGDLDRAFEVRGWIRDADGNVVAKTGKNRGKLAPGKAGVFFLDAKIKAPSLWSPETPCLYRYEVEILSKGKRLDSCQVNFGVRTVVFDADKGFFLNGKHVFLKGTNNHQDHAGVGVAVPDALHEYRIRRLKGFGSNACRCSHHPPSPAFLDACDRLGMLVLDENRLMGTTPEHLRHLKEMVLRDRNHPSVIAWSIGNEEWGIEGNVYGERIAKGMRNTVHELDPTRLVTVGSSGGWGKGNTRDIDLMGFNYTFHGDIDRHHRAFPGQPAIGTEESTSQGTRGIYFTDAARGHMASSDRKEKGPSIEFGLNYYARRPFLSGLFFWTGFDYRGEPNPYVFPAVSSQFGILDTCGFPKDPSWYLKSWWRDEPVIHIAPHWTWPGREGEKLGLWVYANGDEVELWVNGKSRGRKKMRTLSHLEWRVSYQPGEVTAKSYKKGEEIASQTHRTAGKPAALVLNAHRSDISGDGKDVAVISVGSRDAKGEPVPTASDEVSFFVDGPGKIIGVGNGDPSSHEPDLYFDQFRGLTIHNLKMLELGSQARKKLVNPGTDASRWKKFQPGPFIEGEHEKVQPEIVVRGEFDMTGVSSRATVTLMAREIVAKQQVFVNGVQLTVAAGTEFPVESSLLKRGVNTFAVIGRRLVPRYLWDAVNTDPGTLRVVTPAQKWKRRLFNGLAQVILQSTGGSGKIVLVARAKGMPDAALEISSRPAAVAPFIPAEKSTR